jgi:hypothetical protein
MKRPGVKKQGEWFPRSRISSLHRLVPAFAYVPVCTCSCGHFLHTHTHTHTHTKNKCFTGSCDLKCLTQSVPHKDPTFLSLKATQSLVSAPRRNAPFCGFIGKGAVPWGFSHWCQWLLLHPWPILKPYLINTDLSCSELSTTTDQPTEEERHGLDPRSQLARGCLSLDSFLRFPFRPHTTWPVTLLPITGNFSVLQCMVWHRPPWSFWDTINIERMETSTAFSCGPWFKVTYVLSCRRQEVEGKWKKSELETQQGQTAGGRVQVRPELRGGGWGWGAGGAGGHSQLNTKHKASKVTQWEDDGIGRSWLLLRDMSYLPTPCSS